MLKRTVLSSPTRILLCTAVLLSACAPPEDEELPASEAAASSELTISAGGSSFAAPIIESWISAYEKVDDTVNVLYRSVGSGEGINQFNARLLDLAATDAPLSVDEMAEMNVSRQVPVTAGMIGITYNMPDLQAPLKLSRAAYTGIFLGTIDRWDDPLIVSDNPSARLPAKLIQLVARSDSSGTTHSFTKHLSAISPQWAAGPGSSKRISWLGGTMEADGNEGVAGRIKLTLGSIGYVNSGFAERLGLPLALLENREGNFVAPTVAGGQAAMSSAESNDITQIAAAMIDPTGTDSYPITTYTWLLLRDSYGSEGKDTAVRNLLEWSLNEGQDHAKPLHYIPLPDSVSDAARSNLRYN